MQADDLVCSFVRWKCNFAWSMFSRSVVFDFEYIEMTMANRNVIPRNKIYQANFERQHCLTGKNACLFRRFITIVEKIRKFAEASATQKVAFWSIITDASVIFKGKRTNDDAASIPSEQQPRICNFAFQLAIRYQSLDAMGDDLEAHAPDVPEGLAIERYLLRRLCANVCGQISQYVIVPLTSQRRCFFFS